MLRLVITIKDMMMKMSTKFTLALSGKISGLYQVVFDPIVLKALFVEIRAFLFLKEKI